MDTFNEQWAIVNTTTGECVEVYKGLQIRAMDVAQSYTKRDATAAANKGTISTTMYHARAATMEDKAILHLV